MVCCGGGGDINRGTVLGTVIPPPACNLSLRISAQSNDLEALCAGCPDTG